MTYVCSEKCIITRKCMPYWVVLSVEKDPAASIYSVGYSDCSRTKRYDTCLANDVPDDRANPPANVART